MNDYQRIAQIIRYVDEHRIEQPDLEELAEQVGLSSFHFHRLFSRWAGITPKDFLQVLTLSHAKEALREGRSVLDASLDTGLSGPSRLHDLCVTLEAASPGEVKSGGRGWTIQAGFFESPFGTCLIGEGPRGICYMAFVSSQDQAIEGPALRQQWPAANIRWNSKRAKELSSRIFAVAPGSDDKERPLRACVRGTEFQVRVWRALLRIPMGTLVSYGQLAEVVCERSAARAVGSAVAQNTLAYLIPCHRVIRETGIFGDYRWDPIRKKALTAWERSKTETNTLRPS